MTSFFIPLETASGETRVAATPETVKKLSSLGSEVFIEKGAGLLAGFNDESFQKAGAEIVCLTSNESFLRKSLIVLCLSAPNQELLSKLSHGSVLIGLLAPYGNKELEASLKKKGLSALALELLPRISRAQSADALSSQANIAGYKSVLIAAAALDRYFPMLMTAAGTVQPAKVVVLGAGVAGLQAIATAKRLGAVVYVSDIRLAVKEQVESLGAKFINLPKEVENPSESGGYAKQASEEFLLAQRKLLMDQLADADVAICTAQVPGKRAPNLISEEMLDKMRPGAVVVDLAVSQGGNCSHTKPSQTILRKGVKLIGANDLPRTVSNHASALYSRNLLALIRPLLKDNELCLSTEDELIDGSLISKDGVIRISQVFNSGGGN